MNVSIGTCDSLNRVLSPAVCGPVQGIDFSQVAFQCLPGLQLYAGCHCDSGHNCSELCVVSRLTCCLMNRVRSIKGLISWKWTETLNKFSLCVFTYSGLGSNLHTHTHTQLIQIFCDKCKTSICVFRVSTSFFIFSISPMAAVHGCPDGRGRMQSWQWDRKQQTRASSEELFRKPTASHEQKFLRGTFLEM